MVSLSEGGRQEEGTYFFAEEERVARNFQYKAFMLEKKRKIGRSVFPEVLSRGNILQTHLFTLRSLFDKKKNGAPSRFSFVVSKKVAGTASTRNRLKRRGYAIIGKNVSRTRPGYASIFFMKKGAPNVSFKILEEEIISALKKKNIFS